MLWGNPRFGRPRLDDHNIPALFPIGGVIVVVTDRLEGETVWLPWLDAILLVLLTWWPRWSSVASTALNKASFGGMVLRGSAAYAG